MQQQTTDSKEKRFLTLHDQLSNALKSHQPEMVEAFFEEEFTLEELQELLTSTNSNGFTPLHEAIGSESVKVLTSFVCKIQAAFNGYQTQDDCSESDKSDEIIRRLCNESGDGCAEMKSYLEDLRYWYPAKVAPHASVRPKSP